MLQKNIVLAAVVRPMMAGDLSAVFRVFHITAGCLLIAKTCGIEYFMMIMKNKVHHTPETLPADILRTVTYFDLFAYPVTTDQIYTFLQRNSVTREDVRSGANGLVGEGRLECSGEFYYLPDRPSSAAADRQSGEREAERMLAIARSVARMMKRVPFVRAVFITGSLSKSIADHESDIDFMIVTAPGRLWIVRSLLTLIRKLFLLGSRKYFCTNYYVTENGFPLRRRNLYTAIETVTVKPVWDDGAFERFQQQNSWTRDFLPNMHPAADPALLIAPRRSLLQRITERLLELLPLDAADVRLMEIHRSHWMNAYRHLDKERLASMFIITPDVSASWPEDRQVPVLTRYHERLTAMGLH